MKKSTLGSLVKFLIIYFIILSIVGIIRNEVLVNILNDAEQLTARVSSHISVVVNSIIVVVSIGLIFTIVWFCVNLHGQIIPGSSYINAVKDAVLVLIFEELLRGACIFIFFLNDVKSLPASFSIVDLNNTLFYRISNYSNIIFAILTFIVFGISVRQNSKNSLKAVSLSLLYLIGSSAIILFIFYH